MSEFQIPAELRNYFIPVQPEWDTCGFEGGQVKDPVSLRRPEHAGKYYSNNGVIVIYDGAGNPFVALYRELNRQGFSDDQVKLLLRGAGFVNDFVYVPHSNDGGAFLCSKFPEAYPKKENVHADDDWLLKINPRFADRPRNPDDPWDD